MAVLTNLRLLEALGLILQESSPGVRAAWTRSVHRRQVRALRRRAGVFDQAGDAAAPRPPSGPPGGTSAPRCALVPCSVTPEASGLL